ncbi:MAG: SDR family NAD(P)-dependent oxidoreductase, partial [Bacteroidales bacterium]|nr:SDR family NAD(P)-dependent oxidoreductase [Bacteroidales bacterium]
MTRVLLTGATGYIGSHTAVELMNAGYQVVGVDDFSNSNPKVLEGIAKITGRPIDFVEMDCRDYERLVAQLEFGTQQYSDSLLFYLRDDRAVASDVFPFCIALLGRLV